MDEPLSCSVPEIIRQHQMTDNDAESPGLNTRNENRDPDTNIADASD